MLRLSPTRLTVWGTEEKREYRRGNLSFLVGFPQFSQVKKLGRASPQFPKPNLNFSSWVRKLGRASPQFPQFPQFPKLILNFSSGLRKLGRASPQFPQFPQFPQLFAESRRISQNDEIGQLRKF